MRSQLTGPGGVAHRAAAGRTGDLLTHRSAARLGGGDEAPACDVRCGCGALIARRTAAGIELKCRRCRRALLLVLDADGEIAIVPGEPSADPGAP